MPGLNPGAPTWTAPPLTRMGVAARSTRIPAAFVAEVCTSVKRNTDDTDFSSSTMCCACGGGGALPPVAAIAALSAALAALAAAASLAAGRAVDLLAAPEARVHR